MLQEEVVEKYFTMKLVDITSMSEVRELLGDRFDGTYFLRRALISITTPESLKQIMDKIDSLYIAGSDTPIFTFDQMVGSCLNIVINKAYRRDSKGFTLIPEAIVTVVAVKPICSKVPYLVEQSTLNK